MQVLGADRTGVIAIAKEVLRQITLNALKMWEAEKIK